MPIFILLSNVLLFYCIILSLFWNLYLNILFFWCHNKWNYFLNFIWEWIFPNLQIKNLLAFVQLVLYTVNLLKLFINSNSFYIHDHVSYEQKQFLFFPSQTCWLSLLLSCLISLAILPSSTINQSEENSHPCLLPQFSGSIHSFIKEDVSCVFCCCLLLLLCLILLLFLRVS